MWQVTPFVSISIKRNSKKFLWISIPDKDTDRTEQWIFCFSPHYQPSRTRQLHHHYPSSTHKPIQSSLLRTNPNRKGWFAYSPQSVILFGSCVLWKFPQSKITIKIDEYSMKIFSKSESLSKAVLWWLEIDKVSVKKGYFQGKFPNYQTRVIVLVQDKNFQLTITKTVNFPV